MRIILKLVLNDLETNLQYKIINFKFEKLKS